MTKVADSQAIPTTMRAIELRSFERAPESLAVVERPVPRPGKGQVLVRMAAAPINPSDLAFLRGLYGIKKSLPVVPGLEGSGVVVAAAGGLLARALVGRRVACSAPPGGDGTWAEYMVTSAAFCFPLRKEVSLEQGAMSIVNPVTAWALMDLARRGGHRAVAQTAAASALGRMILRLAQRFGMQAVHIVRRDEQVELLRSLGAQYVLNSSRPEFDAELQKLCAQLNVRLAFDAVAGEMTNRLVRALAPGGRVLIYGVLDGAPCQADPGVLIFTGKSVEGFWLKDWLRKKSLLGQFLAMRSVQKLLPTDLRTEVQARLPLEDVAKALEQYVSGMTRGKVLILPRQP
jgi:NADPH:quinone reductase-like Zn-dependent oxidoreductase